MLPFPRSNEIPPKISMPLQITLGHPLHDQAQGRLNSRGWTWCLGWCYLVDWPSRAWSSTRPKHHELHTLSRHLLGLTLPKALQALVVWTGQQPCLARVNQRLNCNQEWIPMKDSSADSTTITSPPFFPHDGFIMPPKPQPLLDILSLKPRRTLQPA